MDLSCPSFGRSVGRSASRAGGQLGGQSVRQSVAKLDGQADRYAGRQAADLLWKRIKVPQTQCFCYFLLTCVRLCQFVWRGIFSFLWKTYKLRQQERNQGRFLEKQSKINIK